MRRQWLYRLTALALALMLAVPGFALAEDEEIIAEQVEESVTDGEELSLGGDTEDVPEAADDADLDALLEEALDEADAGEVQEAEELTLEEDVAPVKLMAGETTDDETTLNDDPFLDDTTATDGMDTSNTDGASTGTSTDTTTTSTDTTATTDTAPTPQKYTTPTPISSNKKVTLNIGDTLQLTMASTVKAYKSSNKKVASVSSAGLITAKKAGKATIGAAITKKKIIKIVVTVKNPYAPTGISIDTSALGTLYLGMGTTQLKTALQPNYAQTKLKWKSSNKKVVKVSSSGVLTPVKAGKAKITVVTSNKKKASVKVTVKNNVVTGISAKPAKADITALGASWGLRLKAAAFDAKGRLVCQFYLLDGVGKSKYIKNLGLQVYLGDDKLAEKTWSKVNVVCSKGKSKVFKVTFGTATLSKTDPLLLSDYSADKFSFKLTTEPTLVYKKKSGTGKSILSNSSSDTTDTTDTTETAAE